MFGNRVFLTNETLGVIIDFDKGQYTTKGKGGVGYTMGQGFE